MINICLFYFIGKSKEQEVKRINKELANIRSKFKGKLPVYSLLIVIVCMLNYHDSIQFKILNNILNKSSCSLVAMYTWHLMTILVGLIDNCCFFNL